MIGSVKRAVNNARASIGIGKYDCHIKDCPKGTAIVIYKFTTEAELLESLSSRLLVLQYSTPKYFTCTELVIRVRRASIIYYKDYFINLCKKHNKIFCRLQPASQSSSQPANSNNNNGYESGDAATVVNSDGYNSDATLAG